MRQLLNLLKSALVAIPPLLWMLLTGALLYSWTVPERHEAGLANLMRNFNLTYEAAYITSIVATIATCAISYLLIVVFVWYMFTEEDMEVHHASTED